MIFLGIDCGTQSTKTIALDWESGRILASGQKSYGFVPNLPPGAMEQHPKDWIDAAEQSIGEVINTLGGRKEEIRGIGVSGQQHGLGRPRRGRSRGAPGQTMERHDDRRGVRPNHRSFWRAGRGHFPGREHHAHGLYRPENPVAAPERAGKLGENTKCSAPSRLPELLAHRREENGVRRCFRHRFTRRENARVVNASRWTTSPRIFPESFPSCRLPPLPTEPYAGTSARSGVSPMPLW